MRMLEAAGKIDNDRNMEELINGDNDLMTSDKPGC
jgi:hypothetical protein